MTLPSPLERLAGSGGVLTKEPPDAKEFAGLVRSGLARLKDAENEANSLDSRFDLACSAAHAFRLAALRHHGFRSSRRYVGAPRRQRECGRAADASRRARDESCLARKTDAHCAFAVACIDLTRSAADAPSSDSP
jgi:hypothetical protein